MERAVLLFVGVVAALLMGGCATGPTYIPANQRRIVDRQLVDYPGGVRMEEIARNLTAPVDLAIDNDGTLIVAEAGIDGNDPRIYGMRTDGSVFWIYPAGQPLPFSLPSIPGAGGFELHGPIGGIALDRDNKRLYVTHRDAHGNGMITCFQYDGAHYTVVAGLPCQGDYSITDVAIAPPTNRLWFGVGAATNSGVVGLDNWYWAKRHGKFCDVPAVSLKLNGYHFMSKNPDAGLFGGSDIAVTGPFQPFGQSTKSVIPASRNGMPTATIYSCNANGGGLRVEAHGIRDPRGIAFNEYGTPFATDDGLELGGTRPVKDDRDSLLKVIPGTWYGWPDYSADLRPITDATFQPPPEMAIKHGYPDVASLIDHNASHAGEGLIDPSLSRGVLVQGVFASLSGAAKFDFVPNTGPLRRWRGSAIVALSGDRAPFATSGVESFRGPIGFKVVRVDMMTHAVHDVVRNTKGGPSSRLPKGEGLLERPVAAKFGPDGTLYIVDEGELTYKDGNPRVKKGTGRIFILKPAPGTAGKMSEAAE
jgi:glucose/arabinose dehydrogenase